MASKLQSISQISADIDMFPKVLQDAKHKRDDLKRLISKLYYFVEAVLYGDA